MTADNIQIVTIPKTELMALIDDIVTKAISRALNPPDEVMTKSELAAYLKKSNATITRWMADGMPHKKGGRPTFLRSEIDRWLASN